MRRGEHVDLGAALDLEDADAVALAQHVIDGRVAGIDVELQRVIAQIMAAHEIEAFADAGEHAERQHIDLHDAQRVDIVLVPFDEGAIVHRGIVDRHHLVEPALGQHEAADMLREMARQIEDSLHEVVEARDLGIVGIEAGFGHPLLLIAGGVAAPDHARHARSHILGQAQRLADLAHGAACTIMDDGRGDARALAAIAPVHILDDFLAPLMLEVDVDVRRLLALSREEAREEQVMLHRIDRGDAEQEADDAVCRAATPLAENGRILRACITDDVVHGQEIMGGSCTPG